MPAPDKVRIDKFLWCVRLFKTRTLAARACQGGLVKLNGQPIKPSHAVKVGDIVSSQREGVSKIIKILELLDRRVGAAVLSGFVDDLTPASDPAASTDTSPTPRPIVRRKHRKTSGRPVKRDRRQMEEWFRMNNCAAEGA
ncbi:MAG: RNA-binding S4 domain-containing protein [Candidatus Methylacidiphilales bacterium]